MFPIVAQFNPADDGNLVHRNSPMIAQSVSLKPLSVPGISIVRATDATAQSFVPAVLNSSPSAAILDLLPYSVVLDNKTAHTVLAYTMRLTFADGNGATGGRNRQCFNFDRASNGMEIPAGETRLVTPVFSLRGSPASGHQTTGSSSSEEALATVLRTKAASAINAGEAAQQIIERLTVFIDEPPSKRLDCFADGRASKARRLILLAEFQKRSSTVKWIRSSRDRHSRSIASIDSRRLRCFGAAAVFKPGR